MYVLLCHPRITNFFFFFYLAETTLGVYAVRVLLAMSADVPLALADEARGVGEASVLLLRLGAHPQRVRGGAAVETDACGSLDKHPPTHTHTQGREASEACVRLPQSCQGTRRVKNAG